MPEITDFILYLFTIFDCSLNVNGTMNEQTIVQEALERLIQHNSIKATWQPDFLPLDGKLKLEVGDRTATFLVEVKAELRVYQLEEIKKLQEDHSPFMLIVYRLYPRVKEELKALNIPYLDGAGNIFVNTKGLYLWIDGQKLPAVQVKPQTNRAFTRKGLEAVFYLLQNPDAINATHRELATLTGTALGNITNVTAGLQEAGYLLNLTSKTKKLQNKKGLLHRWITGYQETLKPALHLGTYFLFNRPDWHNLELTDNTAWGGEPAAEEMTEYLRAETLTVYTTEEKALLIRNWKLVPKETGNLALYRKFWKSSDRLAPPLLVYADLVLTNEPRCLQTAERIYDRYLKKEFE